jgi:hypothetical protein
MRGLCWALNSFAMTSQSLQILKQKLWPGYADGDVVNIPNIHVSREIGASQAAALSECMLFLTRGVKDEFKEAIGACSPLRTFFNLKLFEAPVKETTDRLKFHIDICEGFARLNKALLAQKENNSAYTMRESMDIFDNLCQKVVEALDPNVFLDQERFPSLKKKNDVVDTLTKGSANTSSWWGRLCATAAVTTAAAVATSKYGTSSYTGTVANLGDLAAILPLAIDAVRNRQSITKSKIITSMLVAAAQMFGTTRTLDSGTWVSGVYRITGMHDSVGPPTLPLNCLPIVASWALGQPKLSTAGLVVANGYLTAQDYVNIPVGSRLVDLMGKRDFQILSELLLKYTENTKSLGYLKNAEYALNDLVGFRDLKRNFILPFLMDPVQIANKFVSDFARVKEDKDLAEDIYPSIHAYFQNLAGVNISEAKSIFVLKHDAKNTASKLNDLDGYIHASLDRGDGTLVKYIDGQKKFENIEDIQQNIRKYINLMRYGDINLNTENLKEVNKLLANKDFLHFPIQDLKNGERMSSVLLFSMFQARNPTLKWISENTLKRILHEIKGNYKTNIGDFERVIELSAEVLYQPDYCLKMDKEMIGLYDHAVFYNAVAPALIKQFQFSYNHMREKTNLDFYFVASKVKDEFNKYQSIQPELIKSLVSKIESATQYGYRDLAPQQTMDLIIRHMDLIENPHIESLDYSTDPEMDLLNFDENEGDDPKQIRDHHHRMMRLFGFISSKSTAFGRISHQKFNEFYEDIYSNALSSIFPAADQTIFLELGTSRYLDKDGSDLLSYEFLRKMYDANKSMFWIPILALVIKDKTIPEEYWNIAKIIHISSEDAASYFDFLCRWVYPLSYDSSQKPKILEFSKVLSSKFEGVSELFHYLKGKTAYTFPFSKKK